MVLDVDAFIPDFALEGPFEARVATSEDVDLLVPVEQLSQSAPWTRRVFVREFGLDISQAWLVEWTDADAPWPVAAYLVFWLVHDEIHVLNVVVHPEARRRGLARRMLENLIERGEEQGAAIVSLELRVGNDAARRLYESLGFVPIGARSNYYADNQEDAEVMALLLSG